MSNQEDFQLLRNASYTQRLNWFIKLYTLIKKFDKDKKITLQLAKAADKDGVPIRLWILRERYKLTVGDFANILGIPLEEYKNYEKIKAKVPITILEKVASKFGVSLEWLKADLPLESIEIKSQQKTLEF
jgi:DNA-binding transcriptional regulator YiaG